MKAKETMVLEFLQNSSQFIIPIYQRTYSWELEQCQQLWDDVDKGRWGNGEVTLEVDSQEDITYAMFLIKQTYDRQFDGV